tara:strand:+ start:80411 stop:80644 length:234 start_codon:yes stop_codon:yes gene_type:complete
MNKSQALSVVGKTILARVKYTGSDTFLQEFTVNQVDPSGTSINLEGGWHDLADVTLVSVLSGSVNESAGDTKTLIEG